MSLWHVPPSNSHPQRSFNSHATSCNNHITLINSPACSSILFSRAILMQLSRNSHPTITHNSHKLSRRPSQAVLLFSSCPVRIRVKVRRSLAQPNLSPTKPPLRDDAQPGNRGSPRKTKSEFPLKGFLPSIYRFSPSLFLVSEREFSS